MTSRVPNINLIMLENYLFNMTLKSGLIKGQIRVSPLCNLNINLLFVYLKVHKKLFFICLSFHVWI